MLFPVMGDLVYEIDHVMADYVYEICHMTRCGEAVRTRNIARSRVRKAIEHGYARHEVEDCQPGGAVFRLTGAGHDDGVSGRGYTASGTMQERRITASRVISGTW